MYILRRRNIIIISVLLIVALTFTICFSALLKTPTVDTSNKIKIVLDAGHGGKDGGVSGINTGVKESELNLSIVKKLQKNLTDAGMSVILTRNSDAGLYGVATKNLKRKDMAKRKEIIHNAEPTLVISVHMNKYSLSSRRGAQVFYKDSDNNAKILAQNMQTELNLMEESVRTCSILKGDYYILNCSEYPSIIVECGFLSNPEDERLLIDDEYQNILAYTMFKGIVSYLSQMTINFIK